MSNFKKVDIESWERKEQFYFFRDYDNPFFGLTANLDVTHLLAFTKARNYSFFAAYLFASQKQVNAIKEFRYRIAQKDVIEYEQVQAGSTVLKENNVFTFCHFEQINSFPAFHQHITQQITKCRKASNPLLDHEEDLAQIHYSVIPWVHFTGLSHSRNHIGKDSIPKIVFGKYEEDNGKFLMPVSVEAHHALLDGYHLGLYFKRFQESINDPETLLEG